MSAGPSSAVSCMRGSSVSTMSPDMSFIGAISSWVVLSLRSQKERWFLFNICIAVMNDSIYREQNEKGKRYPAIFLHFAFSFLFDRQHFFRGNIKIETDPHPL